MKTYPIASMQQVYSSIYLYYGKSGNEYFVTLYDRENGKPATTKMFKTAAKATEVFTKIAGWICMSMYSDEQRRRYLMTGTME